MSALTVSQDPDQNWDDLVRYWEEMEWPEGSKVEIIEGIITVSLSPTPRHNVASSVVRDVQETDSYLPAALAELVVEVTSRSNARHDRVSKPAAYATAGIPLYLLVDRRAPGGPTVTLYGEPKGDVYRVLSAVKFGEPVKLPTPFEVTIDTSEFIDD